MNLEDEVLSLVVLIGIDPSLDPAILDFGGVEIERVALRGHVRSLGPVGTPRGESRACSVQKVQSRGLSLVSTEPEGDNAALLLLVSAGQDKPTL